LAGRHRDEVECLVVANAEHAMALAPITTNDAACRTRPIIVDEEALLMMEPHADTPF
jgi:hypothetical protein